MIILYRLSDGWHLWDSTIGADVRNVSGPMIYADLANAIHLCQIANVKYQVHDGFFAPACNVAV